MQFSDQLMVNQLRLRGFSSRHVPTSAGRMHVLESKGRGSLPPVLVLHGFSAAGHLYDGVLLRMRPHVRHVIAPDMLGHGFSDMPESGLDHDACRRAMLETLDRVVTEPVIVFGNSLGGAAALKFAAARPEKVRGLFLVAPGGARMEEPELSRFVAQFRLETHEDALGFVDRLFAKPHPMRQVLAWGTRKQFAKPGLRALLERMRPNDLLGPEELAKLRMPIHLLWGAHDRILDPSHLEFFRRHLPAHAGLQVVDHFGHTPHMDHPDDLHGRLLAFTRLVGSRPHHWSRPSTSVSASANRPNSGANRPSVAP